MAFARRQIRGLSSLDPEDVVSEVFYSLLDRGDLIAETENLVAYIYRAMGNRILDVRRRESRTRGSGEVDMETLADPGPDPHGELQVRQVRQRLSQAMATLNPKERAIWVATEVEGQNFRELARLWGVPMGTLLSRKSRAAAKLREQLADLR